MRPKQKLSPNSNNESREEVGTAERQLIYGKQCLQVTRAGFHLSDLDKILYRHTLGDEERSCVSPMSVIIMGQRSVGRQVLAT